MLAEIDDSRLRRQLRTEARASGKLNHPRIAQIFDYGETNGDDGGPMPYIVMELVDGEPLSRRLSDRPVLAWPEATGLAAQIAQALSSAHSRGLVHRDIKPDNVIITEDGVKLIDFGISATVGSRDADDDGRLLGTPTYVAPERIADAPVGPAGDVYSLGVLLYRMLTGTVPWSVESRTQQLEAHVFAEPDPLPPIAGLPVEVADLYQACVAKNPDARPTSGEAAAILARVGDAHVTIETSSPSDDPDATRPLTAGTRPLTRAYDLVDSPVGGRRRTGVLAVVLGAIALAVLAVAWSTGATPAPVTATDPVACETALTVLKDTGSSVTAALLITNTGPIALHGWTLTFVFPGRQTIQPDPGTGDQATVTPSGADPYRVVTTQSGPNVVARSDAGQTLPSGGAATLSLHASYQGANPLPTTFDLNGRTCRTHVTGATIAAVSPRPAPVTTTPAASTGRPAPTADPGKGKGKGKGKGHGNGDDN